MNARTPWHEDDEFWRAMHPLFFGEEQWEAAPREAGAAVALLGLGRGASVLDLGCGPGRHSLELARLGLPVTGVDRTPAFIEEARRRAEAGGLDVEFVVGDMRRFVRLRAFAGAVCLSTSFGYFEDPAEDALVLACVRASLADGGALVIEMASRDDVERGFSPAEDTRLDERTVVREERRLTALPDGCAWYVKRRRLMVDGVVRREFEVAHRLYSAAALASLLHETGFARVDTCGDLGGAPPGEGAGRLVVVGRARSG
jgi:SAM-dependent methyltransferase